MKKNMKIISLMKKYNPNLTVLKITRYGWIYLIIAVFDVSNGLHEMDPFYMYHPLTNRICGFCPTSNLRLCGRIQNHGKIIYQDERVKNTFENKLKGG